MKTIKLLTLLLPFLFVTETIFGAPRVKTPVITSMTPTSGYIGTTVTLNGSNFSNVTAVRIGSTLQSFRIVSGSKITFTVGSGTSTGIVYVTNPYGTSNGATFAVINPLTITSVSPTSGPIGTQVNINGTGFMQVNSVKFNGVNVNYTISSNSLIIIIVPPNTTTGSITLTDGYGNVANGPTYTVTPSVAPFIYSISPTSVPPGGTVTLTGNNFNTVTSVKVLNNPVNFTIVSNTVLTFIAPQTLMYGGQVAVYNPYGVDYISISVVITQPAVITSVSPSIVPTYGTVTVIGRYFSTVSQIFIGGIVVPSFYTYSDTLITFYVTSNLVSGWMTMVNPYGTTAGPYLTITAPAMKVKNDNSLTTIKDYYDVYGKYLGNDYKELPFNQLILVRYREDDEVKIDKIVKTQ